MTRESLLEAVAQEVPTALDILGPRGRCIAASIIGREVLRFFGEPAELRACQLRALWDGRAIHLSAARKSDVEVWGGHMVVVVPGAMLDLDLGQLARQWGLPVPPGAVCPFDWTPTETISFEILGAFIEYRPHPAPDSWRRGDMTEGRQIALFRPMIGRIIRRVRGEAPAGPPRVRMSYALAQEVRR